MSEKALIGARELDLQLKVLRDGMAPKLIRASLGKALVPTLALARAAIPEGDRMHRTYKGRLVAPGFARKNTYIQTSLARDGSRASGTIGVKDEAFYALQFVEFGVPARGIPARPWLVPAFNATRSTMLSLFVAELRKRIDKAVAKGTRK